MILDWNYQKTAMQYKRLVIETNIELKIPVPITKQQNHYLRNVLRLDEGEKIEVIAKNGAFIAEILKSDTSGYTLSAIEKLSEIKDSNLNIHIFQSLCQQKKMDLIVQKATELGVSSITPIITKRCKIRIENEEREQKKLERLSQIAINACQQSNNRKIPVISKISNINSIVLKKHDLSIALHPEAEYTLSSLGMNTIKTINIFIGPEGGFEQEELDILKRNNVYFIRFGPRIMRTETAPIAIIAAMNALWGDCK